MIPKQLFNPDNSGTLRLLSEKEWRGIGITQSLGWEHYEVHGKYDECMSAGRSHGILIRSTRATCLALPSTKRLRRAATAATSHGADASQQERQASATTEGVISSCWDYLLPMCSMFSLSCSVVRSVFTILLLGHIGTRTLSRQSLVHVIQCFVMHFWSSRLLSRFAKFCHIALSNSRVLHKGIVSRTYGSFQPLSLYTVTINVLCA